MDVMSLLETVKKKIIEKYAEYLVGIVISNFDNPKEVVLFKNKCHNSRHEDEFHSDEEIGIVVDCLIKGGVDRKKIRIAKYAGSESRKKADNDNCWVISDRQYKIRAPFCRAKYILIGFPGL